MQTHNSKRDEEHDASFGRHYPTRDDDRYVMRIGQRSVDTPRNLIDRDDYLLKGIGVVVAIAFAVFVGSLFQDLWLTYGGPK